MDKIAFKNKNLPDLTRREKTKDLAGKKTFLGEMFIKGQFLAVLWTFELLLQSDHLFSCDLQNEDKLCTNHK